MNGPANYVSSIGQGAPPGTGSPHQPGTPPSSNTTVQGSGSVSVTPSPVLRPLHSRLGTSAPTRLVLPSASQMSVTITPFSAWHGLADRKSLSVMASPVREVRLVSRNSAERTRCGFIGVLTYSFNKHRRMMTMAPSLRPGPGSSERKSPGS